MTCLTCSAVIDAPPAKVFEYATDPFRLAATVEDTLQVQWISGPEKPDVKAQYTFQMSRWGFSQTVLLTVTEYKLGRRFSYRQVEGLFRKWLHTIQFEEHGQNKTLVTDLVEYDLPLGLIGHLLDDLVVRRQMQRVLEQRLAHVQNAVC